MKTCNNRHDLKQIRLGLGLSQKDFARELGMPLRCYEDVEQGKRPWRKYYGYAVTYYINYVRIPQNST